MVPCFDFFGFLIFHRLEWPSSVANLCWRLSNPIFIHDFMLELSRLTSPIRTPAWIPPPGHMKTNPGIVPGIVWTSSWEHCKIFVGTTLYLHGSKQLKGTILKKKHGTRCLTRHKTQVSAMFPRTFPGIETASSWDLCPACQGPGRGWKLPGGPLDNQRSSLDD